MLLEAFVFAYIGLHLRFVLEDLRQAHESLIEVAVASAILFLVRHPSPGVVLSGLFVAPSPSSGLIAFLVVVVVAVVT